MKKVLFIEHITHEGHKNFNEIYIDNLINQGASVKLVFQKKHVNQLKYNISMYEKTIPDFLYVNSQIPLVNRISYIFQLLYVKLFINLGAYDIVILSSYDDIALSMVKFRKSMYLINHDNARGLDNELKKRCIKAISKIHNHLVFNEYVKEKFNNHNINNVIVVSHGCNNPIDRLVLSNKKELEKLSNKFIKNNYKHIVFSPSSYSDGNFFRDMLSNSEFLNYINEHEILIIIKSNELKSENNNILILNNYISNIQYQLLFYISDIILINYPTNFKYRVSSVFFDSCANSKRVLIKDIPAFHCYKDYFNYNPLFSTVGELISGIEALLSNQELCCKVDPKDLTPDFKKILI